MITGNVNLDHLVKVVFTRLSYFFFNLQYHLTSSGLFLVIYSLLALFKNSAQGKFVKCQGSAFSRNGGISEKSMCKYGAIETEFNRRNLINFRQD